MSFTVFNYAKKIMQWVSIKLKTKNILDKPALK